MLLPCEKEGSQRGIHVKTWSGDNNRPICQLPSDGNIRHFVRVENLMLYPAVIDCRGSIAGGRVEFIPSLHGDTPHSWHESLPNLSGKMFYTFHRAIRAVSPGNDDDDIIDTEVTINWRQRGVSRTVSLSITVTT